MRGESDHRRSRRAFLIFLVLLIPILLGQHHDRSDCETAGTLLIAAIFTPFRVVRVLTPIVRVLLAMPQQDDPNAQRQPPPCFHGN